MTERQKLYASNFRSRGHKKMFTSTYSPKNLNSNFPYPQTREVCK